MSRRKLLPVRLISNLPLLERLQEIHDETPVKAWKKNLKETAEVHELNTNVLKKF